MPPTPLPPNAPPLRHFVRTVLTPLFTLPALTHALSDTPVYRRLAALTAQWRERAPEARQTAAAEDEAASTASHPGARLRLPSKVHVLRVLWDGHTTQSAPHAALWAALTADAADAAWHDDLARHLARVGRRADAYADVDAYHWLHAHAHEALRRLGEPATRAQLVALGDPLVRWCCDQWAAYPDLYDYFVPLDVQHAYERRAACVQTVEWAWGADGEGEDAVYTLRSHVPHISLNPHVLHDLMYRITLMASLDAHPCPHVTLQWFPVDRRKWVGRVPTAGGGDGVTRGTRRRRARARATRTGGVHVVARLDPAASPLPLCVTTAATTGAPPPQCAASPPAAPPTWNPYQINTGATWRNTCNTVTLWRREEAPKTFLHEMMHGFGWDFEHPQAEVHRWATSRFRIDPATEVRFYESYVETWATLLNLCFVHLRGNDDNVGTASLRAAVDDERRFAVFQAAKVVAHSGYARWADFCVAAATAAVGDEATTAAASASSSTLPVFRQTTSVFSYYIVRALHLWQLDWFLDHFPRIDYKANTETHRGTWYAEWLRHLETVAASPAFVRAVDACIGLLRGEGRRVDATTAATMRMTCVE